MAQATAWLVPYVMPLEVLMAQSPKFVYVIGPSGGPFKIGIADDVKSRRSILNVGNPAYLRIWHYHEASTETEAKEIETELHHHYQGSHIRGEWFQLREEDLPNIKQLFHNVAFFKCAPDNWFGLRARGSVTRFLALSGKLIKWEYRLQVLNRF